MRYITAISISFFISTSILYADTVVMKDSKEIKGLVVDEYVDRIVLNTVDGEKNIFREDIDKIEYDSPEQNFMQLGRAYDAKGWHDKAAFFYKKAMDMNPDYKEAREAYLASHAKIWRQEEIMTRRELDRQNMIMNWQKDKNKETAGLYEDKMSLLKKVIGFSLVEKSGLFVIDEVSPYSSAAKSDIKEGDTLVGIWGRLVRYSKLEDIVDELLGPKYSEVRVLIEKQIPISIEGAEKDFYKELGMLLGFRYEGLVINDMVPGKIAEGTGFRKGDFVIAIDKNITRYLPLDSVISIINSSKKDKGIIFTIRRNVNLRREGE